MGPYVLAVAALDDPAGCYCVIVVGEYCMGIDVFGRVPDVDQLQLAYAEHLPGVAARHPR